MPRDLFQASLNLDLVYPPFLERLLAVKAACRARGSDYLSTELFRTWERSGALYVVYKRGGPRAAPAGASAHNYGLASDEALIVSPSPHRVVRWGPRDFDVLHEECLKAGLAHGLAGDLPHVNWPGRESAAQLAPLALIWNANPDLDVLPRLQKVWAAL